MLDARHTAIIRESQLAAEQIGQGVMVLAKANHAQTGTYAQAFFGLSIGLERTCKLIFLADYAIAKDGSLPTNKELKSFCHNIFSLLSKCETIGIGFMPEREYADRPRDPIHEGIIEVLSLFGMQSRYYNLNYLTGAAADQRDPVALWWEKVALPICERHYTKRHRAKDDANVAMAELVFGDRAFVHHTSEDGDPIRDIRTFFGRAGATKVAQQYGQLYVLQIVRWLSSLLYELAHEAAYKRRIATFLGSHEPFVMFMNEDRDLKKWKKWSIYPSAT